VTVQTILRFPDHHLRATAQRVVVFDEDLCALATDLLDTLRAASAIGITAPHIGVLKRLAVIELAAADGVRTYVNPQIVWLSVCLQHEVNQLDGIFWIYRLSRLKRDRVVKRFDKTQRAQAPGD
jgi:peptide deformylase